VSTSPNTQVEGRPLVGCPRLLIQCIRSYLPFWRPFLQPQAAECHTVLTGTHLSRGSVLEQHKTKYLPCISISVDKSLSKARENLHTGPIPLKWGKCIKARAQVFSIFCLLRGYNPCVCSIALFCRQR